MSHAGWSDLWERVLTLVGAEAAPYRVLFGLGAAFVILMIVEGLRASFRSGYRNIPQIGKSSASIPSAKPVAKVAEMHHAKPVYMAPFRPRDVEYNPKLVKSRVSKHRMLRPQIRRVPEAAITAVEYPPPPRSFVTPMPALTEDAAPFTPLPPIEERIEI
jgi:hypothetical protein